MENTHTLKYEQYKGISWQVDTTWEKSIDMCLQLTKQLEKKWTRHPSCQGPINHCAMYSDLYNEGAVMLMPKEN